jgi:amidohydrolase
VPGVTTAKDACRSAVASASDRLLALSHRIHAHPEIAWEEERAASWVGAELAAAGFAVEAGICGLPTALRATYGSGPLNIGLCAEYDALPGMGHACGHNVIAAASTGAAMALARVADDLGLTVTLLGTPAEEGGGGKILMLERGGFEGLSCAMMVHPGPVDVARAEPYAVAHWRVGYTGRTAHAAAYPELGVNAADAFTVAQVAIGLLRQQLPSSARVHGVVTEAGSAPNAIPGTASGRWYVRGSSLAELDGLEDRVRRCFEAGALATGCDLSIEPESPRYAEFRTDEIMLAAYERNARDLGRVSENGPSGRMNRASTDMGNVSLALPAIHPYIGIGSLPAVNHQPEFAAHCAGAEADRALLDAATALAWTATDLAGVSRRWIAGPTPQASTGIHR